MTISGNHGLALLAILAAALLPIGWNELEPRRAETCRDPAALLDTGDIAGTEARGLRLERLGGDVVQWSEGRVPLGPHRALEFQYVRSFDAPGLYSNPAKLMKHEMEPEEKEIVLRTVGDVTLPIHVVRDGAQAPPRMAAYLFIYANEPVRYPFVRAITSSLQQAVGGVHPLTAILVETPVAERRSPKMEERAADWLVAAWRHHAAACL